MISKQIVDNLNFWTFFNANGRMGRLEYFLIFLIIFGVLSLFEITAIRIISIISVFLFSVEEILSHPPVIWNWDFHLVLVTLVIFPSMKRLQDINLSTQFALLLFLPLCLSWFNINEIHELVFSASLFMYLFLFLKKGTKGSNKYGPDPLKAVN